MKIADMEAGVDVFKIKNQNMIVTFKSKDHPNFYWCEPRFPKDDCHIGLVNRNKEYEIVGRINARGEMEEVS